MHCSRKIMSTCFSGTQNTCSCCSCCCRPRDATPWHNAGDLFHLFTEAFSLTYPPRDAFPHLTLLPSVAPLDSSRFFCHTLELLPPAYSPVDPDTPRVVARVRAGSAPRPQPLMCPNPKFRPLPSIPCLYLIQYSLLVMVFYFYITTLNLQCIICFITN